MAYFGRGERHGCTAGGRSGDPRCTSPRAVYRRVFGVAGAGHGNVQALNLRYEWPSGDWGSLPLEGGIEAAYRRELDAAPDREHLRREIEGVSGLRERGHAAGPQIPRDASLTARMTTAQ